MTIKIDHGIQIPVPPRRRSYPFGQMNVGDSFAVPLEALQDVRSASSWFGRRHTPTLKFSVRKHNDAYRCWRVE